MKIARDPVESGKILRKLRGIRVRTGVAQELGISYSMLCKLEDGRRKPREELKKRLAEYYGVPTSSIF